LELLRELDNGKMDKKRISMVLVGAVLFYAGALSLADDLYVGLGMMIAGGVLALIPLWNAFVHWRHRCGGATENVVNTGKREKKRRLKVVKREEEERPTYH
jgi:hypothetical protein